MNYDVEWSEDALSDYQEILKYLNDNWGKDSVYKFQSIIDKEIDLISAMPGLFPFINQLKGIRRCVLVKQISLYYIELEVQNKIYIIRLLDNRKNPESIQEALDKY